MSVCVCVWGADTSMFSLLILLFYPDELGVSHHCLTPITERLNRDRESDLWPCTLMAFLVLVVCTGYLRACYAGVDDSNDEDVGRQLAPIITHRDMGNTPAALAAPLLHHPSVRSAGMKVVLLLPVTSLMVNGVLMLLLHPSLMPFKQVGVSLVLMLVLG